MVKHKLLVGLLAAQSLCLMLYTFVAFQREGANLFSIFFDNIMSLNWSGQFNLDFLCYLLLSGIWIMWRKKYQPQSIILAFLAATIGILMFAPYLLYLIYKEKGNIKAVLLGDNS